MVAHAKIAAAVALMTVLVATNAFGQAAVFYPPSATLDNAPPRSDATVAGQRRVFDSDRRANGAFFLRRDWSR